MSWSITNLSLKNSSLTSDDPVERRRQAELWCDEFEANNNKYLKSTIATWNAQTGQPEISYEAVDTSLIPPRPRLYGLVGAEEIEKVWKERAAAKANPTQNMLADN